MAKRRSKQPAPTAAAPPGPVIGVCADPPGDRRLLKTAARLAVDEELTFLEKPRVRGFEMLLVVTPKRLELRIVGGDKLLRGGRPVVVDASRLDVTSPAGRRLKQPIAKAVGLKRLRDIEEQPPAIIDATAGWGGDSFLLASLGCRILAVERQAIVATLLRDGALRAAAWRPQLFDQLTVLHCEAAPLLRRLTSARRAADADLPERLAHFLRPDVIYLDPMFPARSRLEAKPMRVLRRLAGDDDDASRLLAAARRVARHRVVVKRPLRAEALGDAEPTTAFKGKAVRYDVYVKP
ncbi:MAG: hypothetical protein CMJ18_19510 [Phycisphaeraceae bacterium]|nr:hypothetical protein [Phycisphaeraceae bacterium]